MEKYNKKTIIMLIISIFFVVFFQTVVYSAFSSSFNVEGNAYARMATDVRITDFKISESSSNNAVSNYEEFSRNTISPSISFNDSGMIFYDVEVTNYNSNDIKLYSVNGLPESVSLYFANIDNDVFISGIGSRVFTIGFSGTGDVEFDLFLDFRTVYEITYEGFEGTNYPLIICENEDLVIDFKDEEIKRILMYVDGEEYNNFTFEDNRLSFGSVNGDVLIVKKNSNLDIVSGNLDTVGSEVCIDTECFYVISSNSERVVMFSKYNLYAGGIYNGSTWKAYGSEATNLQDETMTAWISGVTVRVGSIAFSSSAYWTGGSYGSYPAYVYDSKCYLYEPREKYKTYLQGIENKVDKVRLINYQELLNLGCTSSTCTSSYDWTYSTSYWTGSAANNSSVRMVYSNGSVYFFSYSSNYNFAVRPVIEVLKS